ncbi:hypothetical protein S40285_09099 [Stachybotrys chlorohalonatus IBT 40285]|uniref:Amidohydrolase-related domain-containing protein n=1 Tax=Stachybotrys chlorohalonatus (strain IBT 40285) TaxID=1283841 RepID=A0A084R0K6_STAC4|nr:hypothetical protein S40285_09099 [Stachybotrys chlorohalonata IBT 40285]
MCQDHATPSGPSEPKQHEDDGDRSEPFPWDAGVFDAHCHPTDTMSSIQLIPNMQARCLTIMATRSQDQHLVAQVAGSHAVTSRDELDVKDGSAKLVPAFGWHPWFSHQLFDDTVAQPSYNPPESSEDDEAAVRAAKKAHYQAVLAPSPEDAGFIDSLPIPLSISTFTKATRENLSKHPLALVGEVGLDKAFRLPRQWNADDAASRDDALTPGGREGRLLSPQRVAVPHQQAILKAQLALAGEMGRAVSLHGVQGHGVLFDTVSSCWKGHEHRPTPRRQRRLVAPGAEDDDDDEIDDEKPSVGGKPYPPRICLHSYSGGVEVLKQWFHPTVPAKIFVSFSTAINLGTDTSRSKFNDVVKAVPENRILVESDLHTAGDAMDGYLEDMYRRVCHIRGWQLKDGVARIRRNYEEFIFG